MVSKRKFKAFDEAIFDVHPDLKQVLKPNDYYPELVNVVKFGCSYIPAGSLNTKIIINHGKVVKRVFKTPMGEVISFVSKKPNISFDQVA